MKKILLSFLLAVVAMSAAAALGDTFTVGDLTYFVTADATTTDYAKVDVKGLSSSAKSASNLALTIPGLVQYNGTSYRVVDIAEKAFSGQTNIVNVTMKYGMSIINPDAFKGCTGITWVRMPSSVVTIYGNAFAGCTALKTVYLANLNPASGFFVESAFPSNSGMTLNIPNYQTNQELLSDYKNVSAFKKFTTIQRSKYAYDVYCNDGALLCVTATPDRTKAGDMALVGFNVNGGKVVDGALVPSCGSGYYNFEGYNFKLKSVPSYAFSGDLDLKSVDFSKLSYVTSLDPFAFRNCKNLVSVKLPNSLLAIYGGVFTNTAIETITIPKNVNYIANDFVDGCTQLTDISVDESNTKFSSFKNRLYDKEKTKLVRSPEGNVNNPYDTQYPSTLTTIGLRAFYGCKNYTTIEVPYGVKTIDYGAFEDCTGAKVIRIPSSVTSLGNDAFKGATLLERLFVNIKTPIAVSENTFSGTKLADLYVPYASVDAYKNANMWKTWKNIKSGAYDIGPLAHASGNGFTYAATGYTVVSNKAETINGKKYVGRVKLTFQDDNHGAAITKVTIPEQIYNPRSGDAAENYAVTSIGSGVCPNGMSNDFTLTLGANVDTIDLSAFSGITRLTYLNLNANLKYIGVGAFYDCRIYNDIDLPYGIKYVGNLSFYNNSMKHFLIPSSVAVLGYGALAKNNHLTELILNDPYWAAGDNWDLTDIPSSCKLYVPTGSVLQYKNNSKWSKLKVTPGAYDFTYNGMTMAGTVYHMTVTSANPITVNGVRYDGTAKYVYNPQLDQASQAVYIVANSEKYVKHGANLEFLMTEFGDSALVAASNINKISGLSSMQKLERIGRFAFYGTSIDEFAVPATCTYIGEYAFVYCQKLRELFLTQQNGYRSWGGQFYGINASDFKCYVKWTGYLDYKKSITNWTRYEGEANSPVDRLNGYFQEDVYDATSFSIDHPVDWENSALQASYVTVYLPDKKMVGTKNAPVSVAGTGLLVSGYTKGQIYKLKRPTTAAPSAFTDNLLVGTAQGSVDVFNVKVGYPFDRPGKYFWRPTTTNNLAVGYAYLKLNSTEAGNTTLIEVDMWPRSKKGDVNGDGVVNVSDATALINKILGTASYSDSVCDIDGNGSVDVSDVTTLINLILG